MTTNVQREAESLKQSILENSDSRKVSEDRAEELALRYCAFRSRNWPLEVVAQEIMEATDAESIEELTTFRGIDRGDIAQL